MNPRITVVVPAADEADVIGECLEAISSASRAYSAEVRTVVVADACRDATSAVVRGYEDVTLIETDRRNVGHARRLGAAHALGALDAADLIASTDADTLVPPDWFVHAAELTVAADLVLGTVRPGPGLPPEVEAAWHREHLLRDGHAFVHGANLVVRAGAYRRLGGWRPLRTGEDVDLAERARRAGLRVRSSAALTVRTSTRRDGRVPRGFSTYLRALAADQLRIQVDPQPESVVDHTVPVAQ